MGDGTGAYMVLVGKNEEKRPLGRPSCRWKDNIKMGIQETGWENGLDPAQGRDRWLALVNAVMNL